MISAKTSAKTFALIRKIFQLLILYTMGKITNTNSEEKEEPEHLCMPFKLFVIHKHNNKNTRKFQIKKVRS